MSAHTAQTELKLIGKLILEGELHCETGLHIGAGKGSLEIGGADNPVVKDAFGRPYVPGSSLRGKMRSLLEQAPAWPCPPSWCTSRGARARKCASTRATVPTTRSACCSDATRAAWSACRARPLEAPARRRRRGWRSTMRRSIRRASPPQMRENLDDELTEVKSENAIDRITSQANPRTLERVPAGARFRVRMVHGRAVRRGRAAVRARAGRAAAARRRRAGRRRIARQRPRAVLQPEAGVARPRLLLRRRGREGDRRRRRPGRAFKPRSTKPDLRSCARRQ